MHRFIYRFSAIAGIIALVTAFISGVSFMTSIIRAGLIFMATVLLFIVLLNFLRWAIISTTIIEKHDQKEDEEKKIQDLKLDKKAVQDKLISESK